MANVLTPELRAQLYYQESSDPFLTLITLSDPLFGDIRMVNNSRNIVSRGDEYQAYPFKFTPPVDDGESARTVKIELDNTSLELMNEIRTATRPIALKIEMILASRPDEVQISLEELLIRNVSYDKNKITATVAMDGFLQIAMDAEKYTPSVYPGLF
jgi:hypothetical protein